MPASHRHRLLGALGVCFALAGCGGGEDEKDVREVLDRAFDQPIGSGRLALDATLEVDGVEQLNRPLRLSASGPFTSGGAGPARFDVDLRVGVEGGASLERGALFAGDRAFIKYENSFFEIPPEQVRGVRRGLAPERGRGSSLRALGLDPRRWIVDASLEEGEEIRGTEVWHVNAGLDVRRMFSDLNRFVQRAGRTLGQQGGVPRPLQADDIDKIARVISNPRFDVYVGADDDVIRRITASVRFRVPEEDRTQVGGLEGGSLEVSIDLSDIGKPVRIEAPANARPLAELTRQLGGAAGALGGGLGGVPMPPQQSPGGAGGGQGNPEGFRRYAECLDRADPGNAEALQRCSDLLRAP